MANAYVIAKPWPLATAPQVSVQPMQKFATSVLPTITQVPEGATFEEKYNTLLQDYERLQHEYKCLERSKGVIKREVRSKMLEIQTANELIQRNYEEIKHGLNGMSIFLNIA
jgi:hypothetical protein